MSWHAGSGRRATTPTTATFWWGSCGGEGEGPAGFCGGGAGEGEGEGVAGGGVRTRTACGGRVVIGADSSGARQPGSVRCAR